VSEQTVSISLDRDGLTGGLQLQIGVQDERGVGHGYRIFGPKYLGNSKEVRRKVIDKYDADSIRGYLDMVSKPDNPAMGLLVRIAERDSADATGLSGLIDEARDLVAASGRAG
jgi:hypothetical protein